jgi:hypothetical protein
MKKTSVNSAVLCIALGACGSETTSEPPSAQPISAPEEVQLKPVEPAPRADLDPPEDLPVPADFAQEAETSITKTNYAKELKTLEKEIAADAPK